MSLVIYAKDLQRMTAFYGALTGVGVTASGPDHSELGPDLTIVAMPSELADTVEVTDPPQRREHAAIKPVFEVPDIGVLRTILQGLGGELNPLTREWTFHDQRVCDGHDPEGNVIQLRQLVSSALEE